MNVGGATWDSLLFSKRTKQTPVGWWKERVRGAASLEIPVLLG